MSGVFDFQSGDAPLLVSVPHDGRRIPSDISDRMTPEGQAIPDTDWHVADLYSCANEVGANILVANYSRYVVDLNRSTTNEALYPGQVATGLCPEKTFAGDAIYTEGGAIDCEVADRIDKYWRPYHEHIEGTLAEIRERHGYALLWDAHSIASFVPRLFDGELPALNVGTNGGMSCDPGFESAVMESAIASPYDAVLNGRFQGGFITRHYGTPGKHVHAVQLEIAQRVYMDEASGTFDEPEAMRLRGTLQHMLESFIQIAGRV